MPGETFFMSVIDIRRKHSLDKAHARDAAETLARDLSSKFDVNYEWEGDLLRFKRSGVKGKLEIAEQELHVHLELGLMLRAFKSRIEQEIHDQLDEITGA
jgi:putative polyhydroxyalkanoate system protein